MTYLDLIRRAEYKLDKGNITLGQYEQMIEPLKRDIQPEIILCKDCRWNDGVAYCEMHFRDVKRDDFCSWAERRKKDGQTD